MKTYVVLLRAVNVGGTGSLPMTELKAMCERIGGRGVRTYIASGNALLESSKTAAQVKKALEAELVRYAGKLVGVAVRTARELAEVLAGNPFPEAAPNKTVAIFLDEAPAKSALEGITGANREGGAARQAGVLRALPRRPGLVETQDPGRCGRHRAQHEHHRQAGGDGAGQRLAAFLRPRPDART